MPKRFSIAFPLLILLGIQPSLADVSGSWDVSYQPKPKISVTAFGQPIDNLKLPPMPAVDRITFTPDAGFPHTGSLDSTLFSGEWKQSKSNIKGTASQTMIEKLMNGYLEQGSLYGFSFTGGQLLKAKNRMAAKESKNGTLQGSFVHVSTWRIHLTQPKKMTVPIQVKLLANFKGTRSAAE